MKLSRIVDSELFSIFEDNETRLNARKGVFRVKYYDYIGQMDMIQTEGSVFIDTIAEHFDSIFSEHTITVPAVKYIEGFVTPLMLKTLKRKLVLLAKIEDVGEGDRYDTRHVRIYPLKSIK